MLNRGWLLKGFVSNAPLRTRSLYFPCKLVKEKLYGSRVISCAKSLSASRSVLLKLE